MPAPGERGEITHRNHEAIDHHSGSYPDYLSMETMRLAEYNNPVTLVKRSSAGGKFPLSYQDIVPEPSYRLAEVGIEH